MKLEKRFKKDFEHGLEMWTGEDGTMLSIAVSFTPRWPKVIKDILAVRNPNHKFKPSRVKPRYAHRVWLDSEWFYFKGDKGKGWMISDEPSPFQCYEYELEQPV